MIIPGSFIQAPLHIKVTHILPHTYHHTDRMQVEDAWQQYIDDRNQDRLALVKQGWLWKISATNMSAVESTVAASQGGERVWYAPDLCVRA